MRAEQALKDFSKKLDNAHLRVREFRREELYAGLISTVVELGRELNQLIDRFFAELAEDRAFLLYLMVLGLTRDVSTALDDQIKGLEKKRAQAETQNDQSNQQRHAAAILSFKELKNTVASQLDQFSEENVEVLEVKGVMDLVVDTAKQLFELLFTQNVTPILGIAFRELKPALAGREVSFPGNTDVKLAQVTHPNGRAYAVSLSRTQGLPLDEESDEYKALTTVYELIPRMDADGLVKKLTTKRKWPGNPSSEHGSILTKGLEQGVKNIATLLLNELPDLGKTIETYSKLRLQVLTREEKQSFIVQRLRQSGDSYGVAFSLLLHPHQKLLFILDAGTQDASASTLAFYAALGIKPERIQVIIVQEHDEQEQDKGRLAAYDCRFITYGADPITKKASSSEEEDGSPAGALYKYVVNPSYLNKNPKKLFELKVLFDFELCAYEAVGYSTQLMKGFLTRSGLQNSEPLRRNVALSRTLYAALAKHVQEEARTKIAGYSNGFLDALADHYGMKPALTQQKPFGLKVQREVFQKWKTSDTDKKLTVVLFWVRGPQGDEGEEKNVSKSYVPTVGKPWHHATRQLFITMRHIVYKLANELNEPICICPIGDVLSSDFHYVLRTQREGAENLPDPQTKQKRAFDLQEFFRKLEAFSNRNRFNQLYFLYDLFARANIRLIQVGLRSGAIEQGMYLGVPTVYIDMPKTALDTVKKEEDTTKRMLNMTAANSGFPLFHCLFTNNPIGVHPQVISKDDRHLLQQRIHEDRDLPELDEKFLKGTLALQDAQGMYRHLKNIFETYDDYYAGLNPAKVEL